jgi:hypothetical protein
MSGRSLFFALAISLILDACMPSQTPLPDTGTANPPAVITPGEAPVPIPETGPTNPSEEVTPGGAPVPIYAPQPGDDGLTRTAVYLDSAIIVVQESSPSQFSINLKGNLPTPCHELRVKVNAPDSQNRILIEAYSVVDPKKLCTQVLKPFEQDVNLGNFPGGHYTVFVNEKQVGEFDA